MILGTVSRMCCKSVFNAYGQDVHKYTAMYRDDFRHSFTYVLQVETFYPETLILNI